MGSDKYYRVLLIGNLLLINYGRRATKGQFWAHVFSVPLGAQGKARDLTNEKAAEGYRTTRELTVFELDERDIALLTGLPPGARRVDGDTAQRLVGCFKDASSVQGTQLEGASA
jgi:predicted DNA-binding WGR domain protein